MEGKFKFEQFNVEITNPTVLPDIETIQVHPTRMQISVGVYLITPQAKYYHFLENIDVENLTFEGEENLLMRCEQGLLNFKID